MNSTPPSLLRRLRALPRPVWILCAGTFLNKFGAFVIPFLTIYLTRRGFTFTEAGLALSAYGAGTLVACFWGGYLADRIGRRKTIVLSMFSTGVMMVLLSQAESLPAILAVTALTGLTGELYRPASSALLTDLVPAGERVTAFALYRLAFNAGWAFGPATAGFLVKHSYFWLFIGDAITSVLFGAVAFFALPHGVRGSAAECRWSEAWKVLGRDRRFHQVLLASLAVALVFHQMASTFGLHLTALGISSSAYGVLLSLNGGLVVAFELGLTSFTQKFPARRVMAWGYALVGLGFALNALAHTVPAFALAILVFTVGEMIAIPVGVAYIADLSPERMRGRYMGAYGFTWAFSVVVGPVVGMALFARNPTALWLGCGVLGLLAAAIILAPVAAVPDDRGAGVAPAGDEARLRAAEGPLRQE